ncbi:hypothetical protein A0J61_10890, partial [Choanephora cucurbitarum]
MTITSRFLSLFAPLVQVTHSAEIVPNLLKGLVLVARFIVLFTVLGLEAMYVPLRHALKTKGISPIESTVHPKHALQLTKTMLPEKKTDIMPQTEHNTVIVTEQRAPLLEDSSTEAPTIVNETSVTELEAPMMTEEGLSIHEQESLMKKEPLEEALAVVKEDVVTFEKEEPHVDKEELTIKEEISIAEDNKPAVEDNKPIVEEKVSVIEHDEPAIKDNALAVKEDIPATEDDKVEELAVREKVPVDKQDSLQVQESEPVVDEDRPVASEDIPSLIESEIQTPTSPTTSVANEAIPMIASDEPALSIQEQPPMMTKEETS